MKFLKIYIRSLVMLDVVFIIGFELTNSPDREVYNEVTNYRNLVSIERVSINIHFH